MYSLRSRPGPGCQTVLDFPCRKRRPKEVKAAVAADDDKENTSPEKKSRSGW